MKITNLLTKALNLSGRWQAKATVGVLGLFAEAWASPPIPQSPKAHTSVLPFAPMQDRIYHGSFWTGSMLSNTSAIIGYSLAILGVFKLSKSSSGNQGSTHANPFVLMAVGAAFVVWHPVATIVESSLFGTTGTLNGFPSRI